MATQAWQKVLVGLLGGVGAIVTATTPAVAQLGLIEDTAPDRSLGTRVVPSINPQVDLVIDGTTRRQNLFHSFQEFNVLAGRGVYFANPAGVQNILSRVTGTDPSDILGTLGVLGTANLFLINPNGIVFGPTSALDVQGSFVATTANAIQLGETGLFSTSQPASSNLLTVNPSALVFSTQQSQPIVNRSVSGIAFTTVQLTQGLQVPLGQSLLLVGGDVQVEGGILQAPGGRVELGGLSAPGTIGLNTNGSELSLQFPDGVARSDVSLIQSPLIASGVNVAAAGGGSIAINARNLNILGGSILQAGIQGGLGTATSQAGDIRLNVTETIRVDGGRVGNILQIGATGNAGNLLINAASLEVTNGAQLSSSTFGQGDAGNVVITIRDAASFDGVGSNGFSSSARSQVAFGSVGQGGNLTLEAGTLRVSNGASLSASTFGQGNAGNVVITVRDAASFDGVGSNGSASGAASQVAFEAVGQGGNLTLAAGTLHVSNGARLSASTFGQGDAGDVVITVRDAASFDGVGSNGSSSGAGSEVGRGAVGQGGNLTLAAGTLRVSNGASLSASTFGQGDAGNVVITVRDAASFDGVGSNGSSSGAGSEVGRGAVGQGGNLTLAAGTLHVTNGAGLSSSTFGQGDAGNIVLRIRDQLLLSDGTVSTLSLQTSGGTIDIAARSIQLSGNSDIFTNVFSGVGGGGNITLTADSIIALGDSDILAFAQDGRGGNVTLNTRAFFGQNYRPAPFGTDPRTLDGNNRVDINVSGVVSGVITLPDVSFIQNSLTQLLQIPIDTNTLMANSCIVRRDRPTGSFFITGAGGLPERPGSPASPAFPTGEVQNVEEGGEGGEGGEEQTSSPSSPRRAWKIGDPIVEPQGVYQLPNGELVLSHECR